VSLHRGKNQTELGDIYVPDNTKFTFPGIAIINFDDKQEGQKFVLNALKDALEPGKVYKGWVSIDDSLEMAKKANAGSETHKNVLLEESFNLIPNDAPEVIKDVNSLEAPKGFQKGGKPYNPMAKWEAFSKITGLEGNLFEISIVVSEMPDNQRHAFLEMLKAVL